MDSTLSNYLNLVIPQPLDEDEYIRLLLLKPEDEGSKVIYVKTFEEICESINKYKFVFNIFISLSTYKKDMHEEKYEIYRRQVIFLDFDKKDFPGFEKVSDYTNLIKSNLPSLYNHCIVASGSGGYHFYILTETSPTDNIISVNKDIAKIVHADIKAANSAQVARIPTSYNLKDMQNKKYVKVVNNVFGTDKCKPYRIETLQKMISFYECNKTLDVPQQEQPIIKTDYQAKYYCVEQMINLGCKQGERNFALGRITAKLKAEKYQFAAAKEIILDWNKRCSPPKSINEVETDFKRYWENNNYKLLGCNIDDERKSNILKNYCDKAKCLRYQNYSIEYDSRDIILISEKLLDKTNIRRLNGDHYLIILMLIANNLLQYKIIYDLGNEYVLKTSNKKFDTDVEVKISVIRAFVYSKIKKTDVVVYLALSYLLQSKNNATYDTLSEYLDKEKSSISTYINHLNEANIIRIDKIYNEKGVCCNRYTFL